MPAVSETRRAGVLIVGGGVSGLSAAWRLQRAAVDDFHVLEMENGIGGNSRAGESAQVAYPWGAHYLPLPPPEAVWVRELLAELGVLQGDPMATRPRYDERYLCATPQERLFRNGLWEEGLLAQRAVGDKEREQQQAFVAHMRQLKSERGCDGKRVFALPMALASRDPAWLALDKISFRQWLDEQGYTAPSLRWLARYATRDDYGCLPEHCSAWAGLHYFACRTGQAANADDDTVLTAPEGNAWLVRGLVARMGERVKTKALVARISEDKAALAVDVLQGDKMIRYQAGYLIWAAPAFVLPHVWPSMPAVLRAAAQSSEQSPWLVANLHLRDLPVERHGSPPAWDNVLYDSPGLGYVVATHQLIRRHLAGTVWTYYRALHELSPRAGRQLLLDTPREAWAEAILAELSVPHPDIRQLTTRLDVWRHGHAMARPVPGSVWGGGRQALADFSSPRMTLAHADLSGFSLFEEAQYRGVIAAERCLRHLGISLSRAGRY